MRVKVQCSVCWAQRNTCRLQDELNQRSPEKIRLICGPDPAGPEPRERSSSPVQLCPTIINNQRLCCHSHVQRDALTLLECCGEILLSITSQTFPSSATLNWKRKEKKEKLAGFSCMLQFSFNLFHCISI